MKTSHTVTRRVADAMILAAAVAILVGCGEQASVRDAGLADIPITDSDPRPDALAISDVGAPSAPEVWAKATYAVETTKAVVYAKGVIDSGWGSTVGKEASLLLDAFTPKGHTSGLRPAILFIHGGGFKGGTRTHAALVAQAKYFAARGLEGNVQGQDAGRARL